MAFFGSSLSLDESSESLESLEDDLDPSSDSESLLLLEDDESSFFATFCFFFEGFSSSSATNFSLRLMALVESLFHSASMSSRVTSAESSTQLLDLSSFSSLSTTEAFTPVSVSLISCRAAVSRTFWSLVRSATTILLLLCCCPFVERCA